MDTSLETYRVDSPENVEFRLSLAGLGSRTMAYVLDLLIRIAVGLIALIMLALIGISLSLIKRADITIVIIVLLLFLLQWAYFTVFELKWNGQTPGKRIMKIRVVRDGGYPLTFFASAVRNLLRVVDFLPGLYGIGVFLIFISDKKKRLGDYLAGTIVIHQQTITVPTHIPFKVAPARRFPLLRLSEEEKNVIRAFLERSGSLDLTDRTRIREKIYQTMAQKIRQLYPEFQDEPPHTRENLLRELIQEQ